MSGHGLGIITVKEAQQLCLERNIPFYSYRRPGEAGVCMGIQAGGAVMSLESMEPLSGREGWITVPFCEEGGIPAFFIRSDISFEGYYNDGVEIRSLTPKEADHSGKRVADAGRMDYDRQVTAMISALQKKKARKMVLARTITLACPAFEKAPLWFEKLTVAYPDAFIFLVSVPGVMTWMGATPETFLQQETQALRTMSLAGSRPVGSVGEWGRKELEEQQIVSDYIYTLLREVCGEDCRVEGPYNRKAGKVEHLCTSFEYARKFSLAQIDSLREVLHPTPAVGGFPKREALALMKEIEGNGRRYYAGYLGPLHRDGTFHWYVNLRSMELWPDAVRLYAGGGITALSDPRKEWEETELKSRTLLDVLEVI